MFFKPLPAHGSLIQLEIVGLCLHFILAGKVQLLLAERMLMTKVQAMVIQPLLACWAHQVRLLHKQVGLVVNLMELAVFGPIS